MGVFFNMIDEKVKNQMCVWWLIAKLAVVMEEINTLIDIDQKLYRQYIEGLLSCCDISANKNYFTVWL